MVARIRSRSSRDLWNQVSRQLTRGSRRWVSAQASVSAMVFHSLCCLAAVTLHEVAVDERSRLRRLAIIGVGDDDRPLADRLPHLPDQFQPAGIIRPPVQHHAIDRPGFHDRLGLGGDLRPELWIVEVQAEEAAFVPSGNDPPLLVPQPPGVAVRQVAPVGVPVADLRDQHEIGVELQQFLPEQTGGLDALGREPIGEPGVPVVPAEAEELRTVPDQIVAGHGMQRRFIADVLGGTPCLEHGGKCPSLDSLHDRPFRRGRRHRRAGRFLAGRNADQNDQQHGKASAATALFGGNDVGMVATCVQSAPCPASS